MKKTRLILVPRGELYQVALVSYYAKGRFRVVMWNDQIQSYHDAMATLSRLLRRARAGQPTTILANGEQSRVVLPVH